MAGNFCPPLSVDKGSHWEYDLAVPCNASGFLLIPITWIPGKRLTPSPKSISLDGENVKLHQKNQTMRRRGVSVVQVRTDQSSRWTRLCLWFPCCCSGPRGSDGRHPPGPGCPRCLALHRRQPHCAAFGGQHPDHPFGDQARGGHQPLQEMFDQFLPPGRGQGRTLRNAFHRIGFIVSDSGDIS